MGYKVFISHMNGYTDTWIQKERNRVGRRERGRRVLLSSDSQLEQAFTEYIFVKRQWLTLHIMALVSIFQGFSDCFASKLFFY